MALVVGPIAVAGLSGPDRVGLRAVGILVGTGAGSPIGASGAFGGPGVEVGGKPSRPGVRDEDGGPVLTTMKTPGGDYHRASEVQTSHQGLDLKQA